MNHVTPQTARRLKAAGFPKPEKQAGQFWFDNRDRHWVIGITGETQAICARRLEPSNWIYAHEELDELVFAPSATDILALLGSKYDLSHDVGTWMVCTMHKCEDEHGGYVPLAWYDSNPAEAAAKVYLELHEKTGSNNEK